MQYLSLTVQSGSALLAIVAAVLWARSARVKTPNEILAHVVKPDYMGREGDPLGGQYMGNVYSSDLDELIDALREQSRLSAQAAYFAAGAAVLQGVALVIPAA